MTVQNTTSPIDVNSACGYTPKDLKRIHVDIGPFEEGFLGTSLINIITDIHSHKHIYQYNNTKMDKNSTSHVHVKSEQGYSLKYTEHVLSVIEHNLPRHGLDHKLRQITNCYITSPSAPVA